jgi:hypothetical protein
LSSEFARIKSPVYGLAAEEGIPEKVSDQKVSDLKNGKSSKKGHNDIHARAEEREALNDGPEDPLEGVWRPQA